MTQTKRAIQMNKNNTLLQTLLFLMALGLQSVLHAAPVTVNMQSAIDQNCDGLAESSAKAVPGACIIYTLTTINNSSKPVYNLRIDGQIPEHTRLFQHIWLDHDIFAYPEAGTDRDKTHVSIQLKKLDVGREHAIILQYAVRIEE